MPDDPIPQPVDDEGFLPKDAPPPWGTESHAERMSRLLRRARDLPGIPGVYLMKDHRGVVIYVGKAARLPDRVASYFVPSADLGFKKQPMLDVVHEFEILPCESEWEALLAENRLIKDIRPKFNVRLTDDKAFPYLVVTRSEDFPRVFVTRNPRGWTLRVVSIPRCATPASLALCQRGCAARGGAGAPAHLPLSHVQARHRRGR